jgi:hypothetical protein
MNKKYWIRLAGFAITMVTLAGAAIVLQNPILAVVTLVLETALAYGLAPIFFLISRGYLHTLEPE